MSDDDTNHSRQQKISLNEVWVMCSGTISKNAQDLYSEKKLISTAFYDVHKITDLISRYLPEYAGEVDLGVATYLTRTEEHIRNSRNNATFSIASLEGYEIEQQLVKKTDFNYVENGAPRKRKTANIFGLIKKRSVTLLDGEMGSGKTTLMQKAALAYCNVDTYTQEKVLPIIVNLSEFKGEPLSIQSVIERTEIADDIKADNNRKYLLLVDGWDEIKLSIEERVNQIDSLASQANARDDVKLVIAGREIGEHQLTGTTSSLCETYKIAPISISSLIRLIERVCEKLNVSKRIAEDLRTSSIFKMLPKTPIAAMLLTRLLEENSQDIPSNLTELYSKYTELALGRWDVEKGLSGQKEYEVCERVCCQIAEYLMDNDLSVIALDEAKGFFKTYLEERNLDLSPDGLFSEFVDRSELVLINESRNTFAFRHRTFVEFFYAKYMLNKGMKIDVNSFDFYWSTSIFFWIGLLKDCPQELNELGSLEIAGFRNRFLKTLNYGSFLLAGYQTPYANIEKNIKNIFIESAELYDQIRSGKVESQLAIYSEMQLTAIFRFVLADAYGYSFFKNALETAMLEIEDEDLDDHVKASSLFFLNLAYLDCGGDNIFESMIEKLGNKIR